MHETFTFPIDCRSPQTPLNDPEIIDTELGLYIYDKKPKMENSYDAFATNDIIPSLIKLVERIDRTSESWGYWKENDKNTKLIVDWMKRWGHLKAAKEPNLISKSFYGERLSGFLQEAIKFYKLWNLYKAVANRDLATLKNNIEIYEGELEGTVSFIENPFIFHFFGGEFFQGSVQGEYNENNPLNSYQQAAIIHLTEIIESYINKSKVFSEGIEHISNQKRDRFKVKPAIGFPNLLNAIYMQFFILLSENNKKICPVCNTPFYPARKDRIYCNESCRSTAKSRRYRKRYKKEHGKNYWD